jgi:hypothetical protein
MTKEEEGWRLTHLGRLLGHAVRRFDERVLHLMAHNIDVPLALSNLAARAQISAAHIHITRHLDLQGTRLTELAEKAGMSKQAMGDLVDQCEAWDLVRRTRAMRARGWWSSRPPACSGCRRSRTPSRRPSGSSAPKSARTWPRS